MLPLLVLTLWPAALAQSLDPVGLPSPTPPTPTTTAEKSDEADTGSKEKDKDKSKDKSGPAETEYLFSQPAAMSALDSTSSKLTEPGSLQDVGVAATSFFTPDGRPAPGGAMEVGFRALGFTRGITAPEYQASWARRTFSHTYLSLATTASPTVAEVDPDVLMAVGLRTVLYHSADTLMQPEYQAAMNRVWDRCREEEEAAVAAGGAPWMPDALLACWDRTYDEEQAAIPEPPWNASGLVLSGAYVGNWPTGRYSGYRSEAVAGWLSGSIKVGERAQIGLAGSWTHSLDGDPHEASPSARVRVGFDQVRVAVEGGYVLSVDPETSDLGHSGNVCLSTDVRMQPTTWLNARFGLSIDPTADLVTLLSGVGFQWGKADKPSFMPSPPTPR